MRLAACLSSSLACLTGTAVADSHLPPPAALAAPAAPRTVIARLVDGDRRIIACGVIAFIGVYVYEIESVEGGPPLTGRVVVDVLCPDFYLGKGKLRFARGERHRLQLDRPHRTYAGATAPPSPRPAAPRFQATRVTPAPVPPSLSCGGEICAADQFCEERYKGHALDDEGRPLERRKCMPLPDPCRAAPSCKCVTRHVSARNCSDEGGRVRLDDYPR